MSISNPHPPSAIELDRLFRRCAPRLSRLVSGVVRAPDALIEDACQTAWIRLAAQPGVSRAQSFSWLTRTAIREARRMAERSGRELPLDAIDEAEGGGAALARLHAGPHDEMACRERIGELACLTRRQQRLIWLQALGCSYAEIAQLSGCTERTVHRQIVRARARLKASSDAMP